MDAPEPVWNAHLVGAQSNGWLGGAVAVWGDTMVVSAPGQDIDGVADAGAVAVFVREGREWQLKQALQESTPTTGAYFGYAVAMADGIMAVGAPYGGTGGAGCVYVYRLSGSSWVLETCLAPESLGVTSFGAAVATQRGRIVVGAPTSDSSKGLAFVYEKSGSLWVGEQISDPTPAFSDRFGTAVAIYGDRVAVSSSLEFNAGVPSGSVHLFEWYPVENKFMFQQTIVPPEPSALQYFGAALAMERDTLVIGAPGKPLDSVSRHGIAYRCLRSESSVPRWSLATTLTPSSPLGEDAQMGAQVSISGAVIAVGAPGYLGAQGAVLTFDTSGNPGAIVLTPSVMVRDTSPQDGAGFGAGLGLSGGNLVCGAPNYDGSTSNCGRVSACTFWYPLTPAFNHTRVAGSDRYLTCVAASKRGFPFGAPAVMVCTGENWPDALGGAGLAGAAHGPVLLTRKAALPDATLKEIGRLGAVKAYVIGGTGVVSAAVEGQLKTLLGSANVTRIAGADRYATARLVANETIRLRGSGYLGLAVIATGANFPDAVGASPLLARNGTPLVLANPTSVHVDLPTGVSYAVVAGGTSAVSEEQYNDLVSKLGEANVVRKWGADRYATAAALAQFGVDAGMRADGVGLATGEKFPDALSAGPMLGVFGSPLLLTRSTVLSPPAQANLRAWRPEVRHLHVIGGASVVSSDVVRLAQDAAWGP